VAGEEKHPPRRKKLDAEILLAKKFDHYDLSRDAEHIIIPFLNVAYSCELVNANILHQNIDTIDLWDKKDNMLVQVSSQGDIVKKIRDTKQKQDKSAHPTGLSVRNPYSS
jgi:hypothetical protein